MPAEKPSSPSGASSSKKAKRRSAGPAKDRPLEGKGEDEGGADNRPPEPSEPSEPDDLTVSGLEEYIVACSFGATGPVTAVLIDHRRGPSLWVADASGAITAASMDLLARTLVKTRRLVVNSLGWAADLVWQYDDSSSEGMLRYVERNRGVVVECTVHDSLSKVFQVAPEVDAPLSAGHRSLVHCCTLLPEWGLLLTAGFNPTVDVWDVHSGQAVCTLEVPSKRFSALAVQIMGGTTAPETAPTSASTTGLTGDREHHASLSARLVTGHCTGEAHSFCLFLQSTAPPRMSASLIHTAVYSPLPVTDIILSKNGTVVAICFARICIVLHDCETNRLLRELNFDSPLSCIEHVNIADIGVYASAAALAGSSSSNLLGRGKRAGSSRAELRPRSKQQSSESIALARNGTRSGTRPYTGDHLVVGLHSNKVVRVMDLLGSGETITTVDFGSRPDGPPSAIIEGFMWQASVAGEGADPTAIVRKPDQALLGVILSQHDDTLSYLPDVVCFRKLSMSASAVDIDTAHPPTPMMRSAKRSTGSDAVDGTAVGLTVTHFGPHDPLTPPVTIAAVWSMRKVFIIMTTSWPAEGAGATAASRVLHVCYVPDRKVHVIYAKVILHSPNTTTHVANPSAVIVLSDGNAMTLAIDIS